MEIKTTQVSEITISREELDAVIASFIQAQLPDQVVQKIEFNIINVEDGSYDVDSVIVKTEPKEV